MSIKRLAPLLMTIHIAFAADPAVTNPSCLPPDREASLKRRFEVLEKGPWTPRLEDSGTGDWKSRWFLDGDASGLTNTPGGMELTSGAESLGDAGHCVLWTKETFRGDIMVEYDFTRLDSSEKGVDIIYLQATGSGKGPYAEDILEWTGLRKIPAMKLYFDHMNTYSVSYAVGMPGSEYVRLRRYQPESRGLEGTEIPPAYGRTDLFGTGVLHRMTFIRHGREIFLRVRAGEREGFYYWRNDLFDSVDSGRVGLRQMAGKKSLYSSVRISTEATETK